ncbi:hypothetical protein [Variovorax sp. DT-64]|uniref:hypothetical protein n=1 Tax=Variovorax sp. DT-64 TaxID=3396160 RepID=UPI003F1C01AB
MNVDPAEIMALSDNARIDLASSGVGVSILCPALVRTSLLNSMAHRPDRLGGAREMKPKTAEGDAYMATGHDPETTVRIGLDGVDWPFVIVPHEVRGFAEARMQRISDAIIESEQRDAPDVHSTHWARPKRPSKHPRVAGLQPTARPCRLGTGRLNPSKALYRLGRPNDFSCISIISF